MNTLNASKRYRLIRAIKRIPGLVAYYPLNEVSGLIARNYAPANLDALLGTYTGTLTLNQPGKIGRTVSFDGITGYVNIASDNRLQQSSFSVLCILNAIDFGGSDFLSNLISKENGNDGYVLRCGNGKIALAVGNHAAFAEAKESSASLTVGTPALVVGTYDGANIKVYTNGVLKATQAQTGFGTSTDTVSIAQEFGQGRFFSGKINHMAYLNKALSVNEIVKLTRVAGFI